MKHSLNMLPILVVVLSSALLPNLGNAQIITYRTRDVKTELNCPWEIRWGKDNWIWFTERAGRFNRVNPETGERHILRSEPEVYSQGELGMLGFDFHPDFPDSPFIYVDYTYADSTSQTDTTLFFERVVRYRFRHDTSVALNLSHDTLVNPITLVDHIRAYTAHNGSRVLVGPDRKLYVTTGETYYDPGLAQEDSSINGKLLRLNLDGSIPEDNPWKGSPIWTKGHRNPQGLWFGPDGTLYSTEHGPANDDEFNIIQRGRNYGWPVVEGYCDKPNEMQFCQDSNVVEPVMAWTPTLAVCGIEYCNSNLFPEWKNSILMMTLKDESLWHLKLDPAGKNVIQMNRYNIRLRANASDTGVLAHRLRDICISPDGRIFVSTSNVWSVEWTPDRIFEIIRTGVDRVDHEPASAKPVTIFPNPATDDTRIEGLRDDVSVATIYDAIGRRVGERTLSAGNPKLDLTGIRAGLYYVLVTDGSEMHGLPLIVR